MEFRYHILVKKSHHNTIYYFSPKLLACTKKKKFIEYLPYFGEKMAPQYRMAATLQIIFMHGKKKKKIDRIYHTCFVKKNDTTTRYCNFHLNFRHARKKQKKLIQFTVFWKKLAPQYSMVIFTHIIVMNGKKKRLIEW